MSVAYVIVTVFAAVFVAFSAGSVFLKAEWVTEPIKEYGVPESWWIWLGVAKAAGSIGLLVGLAVPIIGVLASIGLILYFIGAVVTVVRARWFSHVAFPLMYMAPVVASLAIGFAA